MSINTEQYYCTVVSTWPKFSDDLPIHLLKDIESLALQGPIQTLCIYCFMILNKLFMMNEIIVYGVKALSMLFSATRP